MTENVTDEQLIHSYQEGDIEAFEALYARYKNALYHYFFRQVNSTGIADELHQDVWLNIIKSASRFNQQSSFKTWLYRIAHNRLVDHYRHRSKQPLHLAKSGTQQPDQYENLSVPVTASEESLETPGNQSNEPEKILQNQQLSHILLEGVKVLPEEQKEVFLLHEKSGLTLQEIAVITNSSFESTKSRLRYAIKKLRHHINLALTL